MEIMLRKVGRKRARVPLTREGVNSSRLMLTAGPVWMKSAALHHSNDASAIGLSELVLLTGIPNQSCLCPCIPLDYSKMRGVFSRPLLGGEKEIPRQIVSVTGEGRRAWRCVGMPLYIMSDILFTLINRNLTVQN